MSTTTFPTSDGAGLAVETLHTVCCDETVALCGVAVPYRTGTDVEGQPCVLCALAEDMPCGAPGCDFGGDATLSELLALAEPVATWACTDPLCPGSTNAIPDARLRLCADCRADVPDLDDHDG